MKICVPTVIKDMLTMVIFPPLWVFLKELRNKNSFPNIYRIILSIILGIPIYTENPIDYIQTNPDSRKLPNSNEFYSHTKNKIYN